MKPSARVALIVALATTTAPTWASLPFYSPDYTFDSTTGTGFKYVFDGGVNTGGKAVATLRYYESNFELNRVSPAWRGQTSLPPPLEDNDHPDPSVSGINRSGWMCGYASGGIHWSAALWKPDGTRIDLPLFPSPFPNEISGYASDINDSYLAVGLSAKRELPFALMQRPVYWTPSFEIVELANPFATSNQYWNGEAKSISSTGIVTGYVWEVDSFTHAMRWDINGTAPILSQTTDTGITFTRTKAYRSSDDGAIVGEGLLIGNVRYGILWNPDGEAIELRNLPGVTFQEVIVNELNNEHYSVGGTWDSLGRRVAVRWSPTGEPLVLDALPDDKNWADDYAYDINDFNFAVGTGFSESPDNRAVVWTPDGDAIDLNSLVVPDGQWRLTTGQTITNTGWISGAGSFDPTGPAAAYTRPFSILVPFAGTYGMGDANFDESIDFADLLIVAQNYGTETNGSFDVGDFNLDGVVNFTDLLAIAQNYGDVLGQSVSSLNEIGNLDFNADWQRAQSMVPEPTTISIFAFGAALMLRRRR